MTEIKSMTEEEFYNMADKMTDANLKKVKAIIKVANRSELKKTGGRIMVYLAEFEPIFMPMDNRIIFCKHGEIKLEYPQDMRDVYKSFDR